MRAVKLRSAFKVLATAVFVAAATLGLLWAVSSVVQPKNNQKEFGQVSEAANGIFGEPGRSLDAIFIGDSEAYSSFSPLQMWEEHGFTSYVSATSGQRLTYGYRLLEKALRSQKPKVVVFETNPSTRRSSRMTQFWAFSRTSCPSSNTTIDGRAWMPRRLRKPSATWSDPLKGVSSSTAG